MATGIGGAFLEFMPTLASGAMASLTREVGKAGTEAGKALSSNLDSATNVASTMAKKGVEAGTAFVKSLDATVKALSSKITIDDAFVKKFQDGAKKVEGSAQSFVKYGAAAGAASGALTAMVPVLGGVVAATAPAVGGMVALRGGMMAVKLTTELVQLAVRDTGEAIGEALTGTAKEAEEALSALPPQAQAFARSVVALKGPIESLKENLGERLFAPINQGFGDLANKFIPPIAQKLPDITGAAGEMAAKLIEGANSGKLLESITGYIDNVSGSLKIAGANFDLIPNALAEILGASGRTLPTLAAMVDKVVVSVATWITKMGEAGKIDAFLQKGIEAFKSLGQIIGNVIQIVIAVFGQMDTSGQSSLETVVKLTQSIEDWVKSAEGSSKIATIFSNMETIARKLGEALGPIFPALGQALLTAAPVVAALAGTFGVLLKAVTPLLPFFTQIAAAITNAVLPPLEKFAKFLADNETVAKVLATAIAALVVATKAYAVGTALATAATTAWTVATRAAAIASNAWAVAVYLVSTAMKANPIGLVITAITALVAIIVVAYKNHEGFREVVDKVWAAIKTAISATIDWFTKTAWPALKTAWDALATAAKWLYENAIKPAWEGIKKAIEVAWTAIKVIFDAGKSTVEAYGKVYEWLWKNAIEPAWNGIKALTQTWWQGMKIIFDAIKPALEVIGKTFEWLWKNIIVPVWEGIKAATSVWWEAVKVIFNAVVDFLKVTFQSAWNGFRLTVETIWNAIKALITTWWDGVKIIFEAVITFLSTTFKAAWETFKTVVTTVWDGIKTMLTAAWTFIRDTIFTPIITFLATTFKAAWDTFKTMLTTLWDAIKTMLMAAWVWIRDTVFTPIITFLATTFKVAWDTFKTMLTTLWDAIKTMLSAAWETIKALFNTIISFLATTFKNAWDAFKTDVNTVWEGIKSLLKAGWDWIKANVFDPVVEFVTKDIPNAFEKAVEMVGKAWEKIKDVVKVPVEWVADNIIDGGIIKGFNWVASKVGADEIDPLNLNFATGGVLPGYTPGRDVHTFKGAAGTLNLSGGEAIMRPEFTRAVGTGFVNTMNKAARTGGIEGVRKAMGFADGGVYNFAEGGVIKGLMSAWDALTDPVAGFKKIIGSLVSNIPGAGALSKDVLPKTIDKLIGGVVGWIGEKFKSSTAKGVAIGGGGGSGMGYQKQMEVLRAVFPGLSLNSGYRPGAITSSGNRSYHASGRAVDVPPRWDVFNWIKANYGGSTKELIFGPAGSGGILNGQQHRFSNQLLSEHMDHVHWAMKNGGIASFDKGGWLKPGKFGGNFGSKPEAVLTPAETLGLKNMGTGELIEKLEELIDEVKRIAPGVGQEINGVGTALIVRNRIA